MVAQRIVDGALASHNAVMTTLVQSATGCCEAVLHQVREQRWEADAVTTTKGTVKQPTHCCVPPSQQIKVAPGGLTLDGTSPAAVRASLNIGPTRELVVTPVSVAPLEQRPLVTFMGFLLAAPHGCAATVTIATAVVGSTRSFLQLCATTLAPLKRGALGAGSTEQVLETLFSYVVHEGLHMHVLHNAFMTLCTFAPHTHSTSPLHETIVACLTAAQAAVVHAPRAGGLGADGEAEPDPRDVVLGKPLTALVEQVAGLARLVVQLSDVLVQGRQLQVAQGRCVLWLIHRRCVTQAWARLWSLKY